MCRFGIPFISSLLTMLTVEFPGTPTDGSDGSDTDSAAAAHGDMDSHAHTGSTATEVNASGRTGAARTVLHSLSTRDACHHLHHRGGADSAGSALSSLSDASMAESKGVEASEVDSVASSAAAAVDCHSDAVSTPLPHVSSPTLRSDTSMSEAMGSATATDASILPSVDIAVHVAASAHPAAAASGTASESDASMGAGTAAPASPQAASAAHASLHDTAASQPVTSEPPRSPSAPPVAGSAHRDRAEPPRPRRGVATLHLRRRAMDLYTVALTTALLLSFQCNNDCKLIVVSALAPVRPGSL